MQKPYRLTKDDLLGVLAKWDSTVDQSILLVACGGTALTLQGYKESTRDVDFLVPIPKDYSYLINFVQSEGYKNVSLYGWKNPKTAWIFDLFRGQTIFQTELLDPVHVPENHKLIKQYKNIRLACLNSDDLIISKMFRGTQVDVDDSCLLLESESVDLDELIDRYIETASYYFQPDKCKTNIKYLITELELKGNDCNSIKEKVDKWTP